MTEKELYDMELHGYFWPTRELQIRRVLGGWIYNNYSLDSDIFTSSVFVPEPIKPFEYGNVQGIVYA